MQPTLDHGLIPWLILAVVAAVVSLSFAGRAASVLARRRAVRALELARRATET